MVVAQQLAEALEAAHERGIVHRDLKPANIALTADAGVKLLDFGLAKAHAGHDAARQQAPAPDATLDGLILGTCAYMSPEQARGKPMDKRTDIWAFGCVLFEMLATTRAFPGETPSDTIAAVLEREPDWARLPPATPPAIRRLLRRCLEKDPNQRLHDVADARIEIEDALSNRDAIPGRARPTADSTRLVTWLMLAAGAMGLGWWLHDVTGVDNPGTRTTRFTWTLPDGMALDSPPTVSPDGHDAQLFGQSRTPRIKQLLGLDGSTGSIRSRHSHRRYSAAPIFIAFRGPQAQANQFRNRPVRRAIT